MNPLYDPSPWTSIRERRLQVEISELREAIKLLANEINLSKLNVKKDFSLMVAHANALKVIGKNDGK